MKHFDSLVLGAMLAFAAGILHAQTYSVDWAKTTGGGSTSTGGVYSVSGTIGQADAGGTSSGGNYSVTGGFWAIYAVQTAGAPFLTITRTNNSATISWPWPATGFMLQQNSSLANTNGWVNYSGTFATNNGVQSTTISSPVGNLFFRLKK